MYIIYKYTIMLYIYIICNRNVINYMIKSRLITPVSVKHSFRTSAPVSLFPASPHPQLFALP